MLVLELVCASITYSKQQSYFCSTGEQPRNTYMNNKIKLIRQLLVKVIEDIDNGNYDRTDDEINAAIDSLNVLNYGVKRYSKRWLCDNILHCSESCFNNYLTLGIIPAGESIGIGFKEKSWSINDMKVAIEYKRKRS